MPTVTATITLYNRAKYIDVLLKSLFDSADDSLDVRAVVVDNGSDDNGAEVARGFGDRVRVIVNPENRPPTKAVNQGISAALEDEATDYIMVLNDDVSLNEGCLRKLVDVAETDPDAILTPLQLEYDEPHNVDDGAFESIPAMRDLINDAVLGRPLKDAYETNNVVGAAMLLSRKSVENIGLYDEMFLFYGPDTDFIRRARWLGHKILLVPAAHALHAHGRFMSTPTTDKKDYMWRWRTMTLSRYILRLKNPEAPLWRNYLATFAYTYHGFVECVPRRWLRGLLYIVQTQTTLLFRYGEIAATYRTHFDPSKRISAD